MFSHLHLPTQIPIEEYHDLQREMIEERTKNSVLMKELEMMEEYRDELLEKLEDANMVTDLRLEMQQVLLSLCLVSLTVANFLTWDVFFFLFSLGQIHQLQVFKKYREFFEEGKKKLERRYMSLLESSVHDILRAQNRCNELENENAELRALLSQR